MNGDNEVEELCKDESCPFTPSSLLALALVSALLHDVCDHKYLSPTTSASQETFLESTYGAAEVKLIKDVRSNVSYSKEVSGKLSAELPLYTNYVRDVVSDADKIEALGPTGE